ncbi:MAG: DUF4129 domain-containing protein [Chloroflexota bacterium]|nr:DUF4129 domain-containing protein [Chloroflexota bacterium]
MRAEHRAHLLILASRAFSESVAYAAVAAILHGATGGRDPLALVATSIGVLGATLVLAAILRERGTVRQSSALVAVVMGASVAWSFALGPRSADALGTVTRIVGFAILGEAYLWRLIGVVRDAQRWYTVRDATLLSLAAVLVAALAPGPIDRGALPALGLAVAVAGGIALSLARSVEELQLAGQQIEGRPAASAASGTAFALGIAAVIVALLLPGAQALLGTAMERLAPVFDAVIVAVLTPLGYLAAVVVAVAIWLRDLIGLRSLPQLNMPFVPMSDQEVAQRLRDMDQARPLLVGAVEGFVALVALVLALVLIARLVEDRRAIVAEGVAIAREAIEGIGLGATLGALLPRRARRQRPPADDGTPATRLRRLYWRLLDVAERRGPGRRAPSETPAEHERRLLAFAEGWREASAVIRAFEELRYGERAPEAAVVERAAQALARVEAAG